MANNINEIKDKIEDNNYTRKLLMNDLIFEYEDTIMILEKQLSIATAALLCYSELEGLDGAAKMTLKRMDSIKSEHDKWDVV